MYIYMAPPPETVYIYMYVYMHTYIHAYILHTRQVLDMLHDI